MSLRAFHIFFIIASIVLALMMSVWGGVTYGSASGTGWHLVAAAGAILTAGLLVAYAVQFVRKTRGMGLS